MGCLVHNSSGIDPSIFSCSKLFKKRLIIEKHCHKAVGFTIKRNVAKTIKLGEWYTIIFSEARDLFHLYVCFQECEDVI